MPERRPTEARRGLSISIPQLVASVLASVSAAIVASFFGVAGTLVGTALGSLVATLGTAIYLHSITRTTYYVQRQRQHPAPGGIPPANAGLAETPPANAGLAETPPASAGLAETPPAAAAGPSRTGQAVAQRPAAGSQRAAAGSQRAARSPTLDGPLRRTLARFPLGRRFGWKGGLVAAVVVFLVAIGLVTAIEKVASATLSHLIGGSQSPSGSTTVGRLFSGGSSPEKGPSPSTTTTTPTTIPSTTTPTSPSPTTTTTTPPPTSTEPPSTTTTTGGAGRSPGTTVPGAETTTSQ